ncbi:AHH domain-containing protein [Hyalangium versicolor]|uniref:AHH domain-containing protein n=1 Tax=Hyalangium versicolor TaxID=2861190 RepID=UPI001CCB8224|nr:AHH domain-containing protein [Hyalangium versicolor]
MTLYRAGLLWLLVVSIACSGVPQVVRVERGPQGKTLLHIPRASSLQPVPVEKAEFQQALRPLAQTVRLPGTPRETVEQTFQMDALSGNYLYLQRDKKLVPAGPGEAWEGTLTQEDRDTAERYRLWCRSVHGFYGDCLGGALVGGRYLDMQGRYVWALALSKSPVLDEMKRALGDMANFRAVFGAALWAGASMLLILVLNPLAPGLVAAIGVGLVLYVGYETLHSLISGWYRLMEDVKAARTFEEIRDAGERFGKVIGTESARALVMLVMAAIGQTAQGFASKLPTLPGSAQVAVQAETQMGLSLPALAEVEELAVTAEGVRVVLPPGAVAMAGRPSGGEDPCVQTHHIATICNDKSTARGGPWTPRFREIFAKAGMELDDLTNELPISGHRGPHPQQYHEMVYQTLRRATANCRSVADCRLRLTSALRELASQIATPGTKLNRLVTRTEPL